MPCTDGGPTYEQVQDKRRVPAMLCALASTLERGGQLGDWLDLVDWGEAGVTREWFLVWWKEHKHEDALRRAAERAAAERAAQRQSAAAKLTPEERRALGL